ncbi:carbohydrate ABC transporter permease [Paenibacillus sacheonensis]|nr:carbohydrate ABC transporter permease [Paenibacillus sacheonensis]MBM7568372.1 ABC-type glycerol-3-phosphate transport system permease component [Paenibacillus sacheonensis]
MANPFRRRMKLKRLSPFMLINLAFLTLLAVIMLLPLIFTLNQAFKPVTELFLFPPNFFVHHPTLSNFRSLLMSESVIPFTRYFTNSVLMSAITVTGVVMVSAMAAFGFSKKKFPGSAAMFSIIIVSLMFSPDQVWITRYVVIANLGIMNTYWIHILPFLAMPVCVFLMKQFIDQVPEALIDAAKIDGAKERTIFLRIVLPMCMPAVSTIGILAFQQIWPETESSLLFTSVESQRLLNFFVGSLTNGSGTTSSSVGSVNGVAGQGIQAASALVVFLPFVIVFLSFQRKVLQTMANSGIK